MGLRVLLYARVHPGDRGGVQAVVNRLAKHLASRGHAVTKVWGLPGAEPPAGEHACALPSLVWRNGLPAPRSAVEAARALARCGALLARVRPHVVNVHYVTAEAAYFVRLRRAFGYRLVLSVHGSDVLRAEPPDAPRLPQLLPAADALTTVSRGSADRVRSLAPRAAPTVIPNGIDVGFWSQGPVDGADVPRRPPTVLAVGRLDYVKGQDVLLRALPRVIERVPGATAIVVGGGGFLPHLESLARELQVADRVRFTGPLAPEAIRTLMAGARCLALPSRSEGLPLVPLEAMAAGLPVVAARVGGVPEIVTGDTAVLVPPEAPDALAEALVGVLQDDERAAGLSARGRARASAFSAALADAAYERVLAGGGRVDGGSGA